MADATNTNPPAGVNADGTITVVEAPKEYRVNKRSKKNNKSIKQDYGNLEATLDRKIVPFAGGRTTCDFFLPDETKGSYTFVVEASMFLVKECDSPLQTCAYVGSALCAFYPSLKKHVYRALERHCVDLNEIYLPAQGDDNGVDRQVIASIKGVEMQVVMASCVCLLFKNINEKSYQTYLSSRIRALGGKIGMTNERINEMELPVGLEQAGWIRGILGGDLGLKKEVLVYLMFLCSDDGPAGSAARYLCMILSWNEMTNFVFVHEQLCLTGSPVLRSLHIRSEIVRFAEAYAAVMESSYPQFFKYFCKGDQESLVQRNRFPILAAVAHGLKNKELGSATTRNFVATLTDTEDLVDQLMQLHERYIDKNMSAVNKALLLITQDPNPREYHEEDES